MATITVTSTADSGAGSLRAALAFASAGDTINFAPGIAGQTITLASTLTVGAAVTIDGTGSNITINGNDSVTDFTVNFTTPGVATIQGLAIGNGNGQGATGAVGGFLTGYGGPGGDAAGGVFEEAGSLNLANDTFIFDKATGGTGGAGEDTIGGISGGGGAGGNAAGAVYVEPGATVTASGLTFTGDTATGGTGGGGRSRRGGRPAPLGPDTTIPTARS